MTIKRSASTLAMVGHLLCGWLSDQGFCWIRRFVDKFSCSEGFVLKIKKSIVPILAGAALVPILAFSQPKPADAACNNWLCGWENAVLKSQTDAEDKKFTSNGFNAGRSVVLIAVLGLGIGAVFTREDKERSSQLLGWGGGIVVVALFFNVIIGYVFGDGRATTGARLDKQEKTIVVLDHVQDDKV
jgi:hypothetical protein